MDQTLENVDKNIKLCRQASDAIKRGDEAMADKLMRQIEFDASVLMAAKECFGADFVREEGLDTRRADAEYGPGWLDRED